jgi:glyoxylase-like metal-dependent hydrolase (beta-lactamase superfamily II)
MKKHKRYIKMVIGFVSLLFVSSIIWINQATPTSHPIIPSTLGQESNYQSLVDSLSTGKKISVDKVKSANWKVPLSGLLNLDADAAKHAGLEDHDEDIQIFTFHIKHPLHGDFLIDTGVSHQFYNDPQSLGIPSWLASGYGLENMTILTATDDYIKQNNLDLKGVFLTHLHLDHISGMSAIDKHVPLYVGEGETEESYFLYAATRCATDTMLNGRPSLQEWSAEYVDVFGDGSIFAIHSPGHTAGSTAYLVNTFEGPVLFTGDASHTTWGWNHGVEPGSFSTDQTRSLTSLNKLIELVKSNPEIRVQPGHQSL